MNFFLLVQQSQLKTTQPTSSHQNTNKFTQNKQAAATAATRPATKETGASKLESLDDPETPGAGAGASSAAPAEGEAAGDSGAPPENATWVFSQHITRQCLR